MSEQKCPDCGAVIDADSLRPVEIAGFGMLRPEPAYVCGSYVNGPREHECYEREIEKLKAELTMLYAVKSALFEQLKANQT